MQGPFFLGPDLSLVDITFVPMMERAVASLAYYKGYAMRDAGQWPAIARWFEALEQRETYLGTRSDHYTHSHDLPPQLGGGVPQDCGCWGVRERQSVSWMAPLL
jgi:glutathione S-transferase